VARGVFIKHTPLLRLHLLGKATLMMISFSTLAERGIAILMLAAALPAGVPVRAAGGGSTPASVLDFTMKNIDGKDVPLSAYKGKVLLIVNVASECGYTPQYKGLEALYREFKDRGFVILGFPANNFGAQEPGTDQEIKNFCSTQYDVTFDLFSKISVKGKDQHPLYAFITSDPAVAGEVRWNFQKYLVGKDGKLIARFPSKVEPLSEEVKGAVEKALGRN
jgi:glutathione peroxidase